MLVVDKTRCSDVEKYTTESFEHSELASVNVFVRVWRARS